jgi:anti-sigma factor RsiW
LNCHTSKEYISAYLDGELPAEPRELLERHLANCPLCRHEVEWQTRLWVILDVLPGEAPVGLVDKVMAQLPGRQRPRWRYFALAASLLLGIFLGGKVGLDIHATFSPAPASSQAVALEVFEDIPQGSVGTMLVTYDPDNGNGV